MRTSSENHGDMIYHDVSIMIYPPPKLISSGKIVESNLPTPQNMAESMLLWGIGIITNNKHDN